MNNNEIKELHELTIQEIIDDVEWTMNRMKMDMSDFKPNELAFKEAKTTYKQCQKWLSYYKRYKK